MCVVYKYNINMEPNTLHTLLANLQDVHCDIWSCKELVYVYSWLVLIQGVLQTNVNTC